MVKTTGVYCYECSGEIRIVLRIISICFLETKCLKCLYSLVNTLHFIVLRHLKKPFSDWWINNISFISAIHCKVMNINQNGRL